MHWKGVSPVCMCVFIDLLDAAFYWIIAHNNQTWTFFFSYVAYLVFHVSLKFCFVAWNPMFESTTLERPPPVCLHSCTFISCFWYEVYCCLSTLEWSLSCKCWCHDIVRSFSLSILVPNLTSLKRYLSRMCSCFVSPPFNVKFILAITMLRKVSLLYLFFHQVLTCS